MHNGSLTDLLFAALATESSEKMLDVYQYLLYLANVLKESHSAKFEDQQSKDLGFSMAELRALVDSIDDVARARFLSSCPVSMKEVIGDC